LSNRFGYALDFVVYNTDSCQENAIFKHYTGE